MNNNLLETIKIVDGEALHLDYHQKRVEHSLSLLGLHVRHNLAQFIQAPLKGTYRCRIIYNETVLKVEYFPYQLSPVNSLKLVHCDTLEYALKYENRDELNALFQLRENCDDILIVKNSLLTDTSKANIALYDGSKWFTPSTPLLYGTTRARLLDEKKIFEKSLHVSDIKNFSKVAVLNAMVDFCVLKDGIIA
jgi:4-amino-4-deoxychorismate lyase